MVSVVARGWERNHGEKRLLDDASISDMHIIDGEGYYSGGADLIFDKRYHPIAGAFIHSVRISFVTTKLNLNGSYLFEIQLAVGEIARLYGMTCATRSRRDIAQLFYRTFHDADLGEIGRLFAQFRDEEEGDQRRVVLDQQQHESEKKDISS
jgi:hypothetical protein